MEFMLLKWKQSYVSDTYEISMWVRRIVRKNDFVLIYARPHMGSSCIIAMQARPARENGYRHMRPFASEKTVSLPGFGRAEVSPPSACRTICSDFFRRALLTRVVPRRQGRPPRFSAGEGKCILQ